MYKVTNFVRYPGTITHTGRTGYVRDATGLALGPSGPRTHADPHAEPSDRSAHIALIVLEQEGDTDVVSKCMHLLLTEPGPSLGA